MGNIQHSAEGTTWSKKNHKYIRKEGNRYIYEDGSLAGYGPNSKKDPDAIRVKNIQKKARNDFIQDVKNSWDQNIKSPINRFNPAAKKAEQQAKIAEANERLNRREKQLKTIQRLDREERNPVNRTVTEHGYDDRGFQTTKTRQIPRTTSNDMIRNREESLRKQQRDHWTAYNRQQIEAREKANAEAKRKVMNRKLNDYQNKQGLDSANANRFKSSNPSGLSGRDSTSRRGVNRVIYADMKSPKGNQTVRIKRTMYNKPLYDDRGFRKNINYEDEVISRTSHAPSGNARDILKKRGVRSTKYYDLSEGKRGRVTVNNDSKRQTQDVRKNFGSKDTRSAFKKKISEFGKRIGIGRDAIYNYTQGVLKDSKERVKAQKQAEKEQRRLQREADRQIPLNMRLKRNAKKGKKALSKYFPFLN